MSASGVMVFVDALVCLAESHELSAVGCKTAFTGVGGMPPVEDVRGGMALGDVYWEFVEDVLWWPLAWGVRVMEAGGGEAA